LSHPPWLELRNNILIEYWTGFGFLSIPYHVLVPRTVAVGILESLWDTLAEVAEGASYAVAVIALENQLWLLNSLQALDYVSH
jgi:hypothetical protein